MTGFDSGAPDPPPASWDQAPPEQDVLPPVPWRWWASFLVFFFTFLTSAVVAVAVAAIFRGDLEKAMGVIAFELTLGFWAVVWGRARHGAGLRSLGVRFDRLGIDAACGLGLGVVGWGMSTLVVGNLFLRIVDALSRKPVVEPDQLDYANPSALVLAVTAVGVIVVAPIAEELFFRGFVFRGFRRDAGFAIAAGASGLLFMVAHLPFWLIFPSIFTLGIFLAYGLERWQSLIPSIVAHALFNTMGFVFYLSSLR